MACHCSRFSGQLAGVPITCSWLTEFFAPWVLGSFIQPSSTSVRFSCSDHAALLLRFTLWLTFPWVGSTEAAAPATSTYPSPSPWLSGPLKDSVKSTLGTNVRHFRHLNYFTIGLRKHGIVLLLVRRICHAANSYNDEASNLDVSSHGRE